MGSTHELLSKLFFSREEGHEGKVVIDPQSLQSAISVRYSDIKVVSIGAVPELDYPEQKP